MKGYRESNPPITESNRRRSTLSLESKKLLTEKLKDFVGERNRQTNREWSKFYQKTYYGLPEVKARYKAEWLKDNN